MSSPAPQPLTPAGARRLYRILLYAGGEEALDPREREVLETFRERWGIEPDEAARIEAERSDTGRLSLGAEVGERAHLVAALVELVAADGRLDQDEQRRLQRLAEFLGLPRQELVRELLERLAGP